MQSVKICFKLLKEWSFKQLGHHYDSTISFQSFLLYSTDKGSYGVVEKMQIFISVNEVNFKFMNIFSK